MLLVHQVYNSLNKKMLKLYFIYFKSCVILKFYFQNVSTYFLKSILKILKRHEIRFAVLWLLVLLKAVSMRRVSQKHSFNICSLLFKRNGQKILMNLIKTPINKNVHQWKNLKAFIPLWVSHLSLLNKPYWPSSLLWEYWFTNIKRMW